MPMIPKSEVSEGGLAAKGWHEAVVSDCEEKVAKGSGNRYYNLAFESPAGEFLAYDVAMLEGKGNGIGIKKLMALGCCDDVGDSYDYAHAHEVKGSRCWIFLDHETYDGKTRAKVDIRTGQCGYLPLSSPPPESQRASSAEPDPYGDASQGDDPDDDIPF